MLTALITFPNCLISPCVAGVILNMICNYRRSQAVIQLPLITLINISVYDCCRNCNLWVSCKYADSSERHDDRSLNMWIKTATAPSASSLPNEPTALWVENENSCPDLVFVFLQTLINSKALKWDASCSQHASVVFTNRIYTNLLPTTNTVDPGGMTQICPRSFSSCVLRARRRGNLINVPIRHVFLWILWAVKHFHASKTQSGKDMNNQYLTCCR